MGEYFRAVNLNKHEYVSCDPLDQNNKLSGIFDPPFASLIVWLLAEGKASGEGLQWLGAWARHQIVIAGDEGSAADVYEATHDTSQFTDITIPVFEEYVNADIFRRMEHWKLGFIDDNGLLIPKSLLRADLRRQRENLDPPEQWFRP